MSYLDMAQGGEGSRELGSIRPPGSNQPSELDKTNQQLIQRVFRLRTAVSRLTAAVAKVGGAADTVELRKGVSTATGRIQEDARDIKEQLLRLGSDQKNRQTTKILNDFEVTLKDFQTTLKVAKGKEAASLPKQKKAAGVPCTQRGDLESGDGDSEEQALLQEQKRKDDLVLVNEMTYNEALIDERDHGIAEIQQQIGEVNEIFQDLAVLVNDQGLQLDDIEANITRTADRTLEGNRELLQAERSQRAARNLTCWILMVVAVIMVVLVLVLSL